MILFDPTWDSEKYFGREIDILNTIIDKDVPLKFIQSSNQADIVEFSFEKEKKTVHYNKTVYYPSILATLKPDVFHMGHRSVKITDEQLQKTLMLLPIGSIILNVCIDIGSIPYFCPEDLKKALYTNYFLEPKIPYTDGEGIRYYLCLKQNNIEEKEQELIFQFASAFSILLDCISKKEQIEKRGWEKNPIDYTYYSPEDIARHAKEFKESTQALTALSQSLSRQAKEKLLYLISQLRYEKEDIEEALKISGIK